ncbi:efflux RND transporter periplasmic adaptor subunit [Chitinimonas sp.]|uniref:efflux RND transporter periplasmic adaptor subunit n=1 Tax=Chitinimonas sp. TaxID=1934313 RepID=UPI0035B1174F
MNLYLKTATCLTLLTAMIGVVHAHGGEDHGDAGAAQTLVGNRPQRLPDGSVFLPKVAQRRLALRTVMAEMGEHPQTIELNGHVVMNPSAGGTVQALLAGRIEAGPKGLPLPGQTVHRGELLAYVKPAVGSAEHSGQLSQLAELHAAHTQAEKNVARLHELEGSVSRKEIEAAEAELASIKGRLAAVTTGVEGRDALLAPVSGAIAMTNVVAGQVVDAKEVLFEVVDPNQLLVEAQAFDAGLVDNLAGASLAGDGSKLRYLGGSRALRDGALPLLFRADGPLLKLALGQPVKVIAQTRTMRKGVALPAAAVVRNPANEAIVWLHTAAERFVPKPVKVTPIDGTQVLADGVEAGARVVTDGATLINQIR